MNKPLKKIFIFVMAIALMIGFSFPSSVFASVDPDTKTFTIQYDNLVYAGCTCPYASGTDYIGDAGFNWFVNWYHNDVHQYPSVTLEEGETYKVEVSVTKVNTASQAYDLNDFSVVLLMRNQPFPYDNVISREITKDALIYTYQVTPGPLPDMNQGAGTVDLSKGPLDLMSDPGIYMAIMVMGQNGRVAVIDSDENGNGILDLDLDGKADIEMRVDYEDGKATISSYGNVSGKAPITLTLTDEEIAFLKNEGSGMPFYSSLTFIFEKAAADVTPISKATIKGITAKVYTGKALKPAPKVVLKGKTLKAGQDYTVSYKKNVNVGTATVIVKGKGNYSGTKTKTFKINPKGTKLKSVAKATKAVKIKWAKQAAKMKTSRISGYQIMLATNSKFTKGKKTVTVAGYSKVSKKVKGLKGGKKYYVKVRTYKKIGKTKYYSKWSAAKSVTTGR